MRLRRSLTALARLLAALSLAAGIGLAATACDDPPAYDFTIALAPLAGQTTIPANAQPRVQVNIDFGSQSVFTGEVTKFPFTNEQHGWSAVSFRAHATIATPSPRFRITCVAHDVAAKSDMTKDGPGNDVTCQHQPRR